MQLRNSEKTTTRPAAAAIVAMLEELDLWPSEGTGSRRTVDAMASNALRADDLPDEDPDLLRTLINAAAPTSIQYDVSSDLPDSAEFDAAWQRFMATPDDSESLHSVLQ